MTAPRAPANRAELIATMRDVVLSEQFYGATSGEVASGILAALEAAGVRLVPVEPLERQLVGGMIRPDYYRALAASPYAPEGK